MNLIHQGEVQYFTCLFPQEKKALKGDRGNTQKSNPNFQLLSDDATQTFRIRIIDVLAENMYSKSAKAHTDIYLIKPGALQLQVGLQNILTHITATTILDRGDR